MTYRLLLNQMLLVMLMLAATGPNSTAQSRYTIKGTVFVEAGNLNGLAVHWVDGNFTQSLTVDANGGFRTLVDWNKTYHFQFSKPGYVSKVVEFNTWVPETANKVLIAPYELQVKLFKVFDGVDSMFFKKPVALIAYNVRTLDFEYNTDYSLVVSKRIEEMRQNKNKVNLPRQEVLVNPSRIEAKAESTKGSTDVEAGYSKPVLPAKDVVPAKAEQLNNPKSTVPPKKPYYPQGRTVEEFDLDRKQVTRVIVNNNGRQKILLKVQHQWGPTYFFVDESPLTIRCVSQAVYERETLLKADSN